VETAAQGADVFNKMAVNGIAAEELVVKGLRLGGRLFEAL